MADQAMYHQGNQSVFVGGRLWTLLPPPAVEMDWKFFIYSDVSHTHPARRGFFRKNAKLSKRSESKRVRLAIYILVRRLYSILEGRSQGEEVGLEIVHLSPKGQSC